MNIIAIALLMIAAFTLGVKALERRRNDGFRAEAQKLIFQGAK